MITVKVGDRVTVEFGPVPFSTTSDGLAGTYQIIGTVHELPEAPGYLWVGKQVISVPEGGLVSYVKVVENLSLAGVR